MEAGAVCFFGSFGLLVVLVLGSALLRAAVSLANTMIDPRKADAEPVDPFADWDWDGELEAEKPRRKKKEKAVPEPGMGKAMLITFAVGTAAAFVAIILAIFASAVAEDLFDGDEAARIFVLALFTLPFALIGSALLLSAMLPTTFSRALLVAFIHLFLTATLLAVVGGTIFGLLWF